MQDTKITYVFGERISTYKKMCKFLFNNSFIDVKKDLEKRTFVILLKDTAKIDIVKRFADFWEGVEVLVLPSESNGGETKRFYSNMNVREKEEALKIKSFLDEDEISLSQKSTNLDEEVKRILEED